MNGVTARLTFLLTPSLLLTFQIGQQKGTKSTQVVEGMGGSQAHLECSQRSICHQTAQHTMC